MPAVYLTDADVRRFLPMDLAIETVERVFRLQAMTEVANIPRGRARTDHGMMHLMGAAVKSLGAMGCKVYTTTRAGARFLVPLFSGVTGELLAILEGDVLGQIRTGAATGVATRLMARPDAHTLGLYGTGKQARTQLLAVSRVRKLTDVTVHGRDPDRRAAFAREMAEMAGVPVRAVSDPADAARGRHIIVTATTSAEPVLKSDWVDDGTHINAVGSNFLAKAEIDVETLRRCAPIVVDDKEQARLEAGDFTAVINDKVLRWSEIDELAQVVVKRAPGRLDPDDVTLFKSVGVAFEDVAVAKMVYDRAKEAGAGFVLPF